VTMDSNAGSPTTVIIGEGRAIRSEKQIA
jgi:hypothetical protein